MRPHKIDNCVLAVNMMEKGAGIKLNFFKAEHLVDHDTKMILGMVWAVILDYQIKGISVEELSAKEGLLLWCQKKTAGYRDVKVENFHTSWVDGLALCALIHRHRPDLINFDSLSKENKADNLRLAFQVAEEKLGIARLLDVEDIVDVARPDERSIITYISEFFHKFSAQNQQELAARRIAKVTKMTQLNDQLKADYNQKASELKSWIAQQIAQFDDHSFPNNLEGVKEKIGDLVAYRKNTKPDKTATKLQLEQLFNNVSMKLRANNRPAFVPADGHSVADIEADWQRLNDSENNRNNALQKEVRRQERLEAENNRFNVKHANLHQWASTKKTVLDRLEGEKFTTVSQVQSRIQLVEGLNTELDNSKPRLDELEKIANGLVSEKFRDSDTVTSKLADVKQLFDSIRTAATQRRQVLDQELELQQKQEVARKEFARQAQDFATWINDVTEGARDYNFGDSLAEVEAFKEQLDKFSADTQSAAGEKKAALDKADAELKALGVTDNQYTSLTVGDIEQRLGALNGELSKRGDAYNTELERQRLHEAKRHEFANQAKAFADSIANSVATIEAAQGDFDAKTATVQGAHNEAEGDQKLSALHQLDEEMRGLGIVHNPHTTWSYPDLAAKWDEHKKFVAKRLADIAREKLHDSKNHEFADQAQAFANWLAGKSAEVNGVQGEPEEKVAAIKAIHNEAEGDEKLAAIGAKADELRGLGIVHNPHTTLSHPLLTSRWNAHKNFVANRLEDLAQAGALKERDAANRAAQEKQQQQENLKNEVAKRANALNGWIQTTNETFTEPIVVDSQEGIRELQSAFDGASSEFDSKNGEKDAVLASFAELAAAGITDNALAEIDAAGLTEKWNSLGQARDTRRQELADESKRQDDNEALRVEFANKANGLNEALDKQIADLAGLQGEIEAQLEALNAIKPDNSGLDELRTIDQRVQDAGIRSNSHTSHTLETTAAKYNSLSSSVTEKRKVLEGEIAAKQHSQVAPEQLNEIRECFKQFDKDNRGSLSNYEFKACLSALGESVSDETVNNVLKQYGNEENRITQDQFTEFMISRLADSDSETQIVNSFKSLAGDRDYVTADQLSIGFDEETKKYLLTQMPAKEGVDGGYDYVKYAQDIFSR